MDATNQSDAAALWQDVLDLLAEKDLPAPTLAMLQSCHATALDDEAIHVETSSRFVHRTVSRKAPLVEECLKEIAFVPLKLVVETAPASEARPIESNSEISPAEFDQWNQATLRRTEPVPTTQHAEPQVGGTANAHHTSPSPSEPDAGAYEGAREQQKDTARQAEPFALRPTPQQAPRKANPLVTPITDTDRKYTFDRFVEGPQNRFALNAAKQVANGQSMGFNPLFIYGKSGLGKTHILKAIWNYIDQNDPTRTCVYRTAREFIDDYATAMNPNRPGRAGAASSLTENYHDVDVLIIDDVQGMEKATGTIGFFFDTFNHLVAHGKQIVMAADRTPSELGMGSSNFDERVTSRLDSGFTIGVQVPDYELKLQLVDAFCEHMRQDSINEHIPGLDAQIPPELRQLMAERAGDNIRQIEAYVHSCLIFAFQKASTGQEFGRDDVIALAKQKWPSGQKVITVEQIQKAVEEEYGIEHADLVGGKRNKELMEPRHVAIWLTRELTDNTLADIGKRFGNRTHATIKHSIGVIDELSKSDRVLHDRIERIRDAISE